LKTWRFFLSYNLCCINTRAYFQLTGHKHTDKDEESKIGDSEYADDTAFLSESRANCECQTPLIVKHFDRWGLQVHGGTEQNT
jgi:hypothetical protein